METQLTLEISHYRAWFETQGTLHFSTYPGSMWRGGLGHSMRDVVCTHPQFNCQKCPDVNTCIYPPLFVTFANKPELVRPFILLPQSFAGCFSPGSLIGLEFILLGWANQHLPIWFAALQRLGQRGLKMRNPVNLHLLDVQQHNIALDSWESILQNTDKKKVFCIPPVPKKPVRLEFLTPLKIKYRGELVQPEQFNAHDLLIAIARRMEACSQLDANIPMTPAPDQWLANADTLIKRKDLSWLDTYHYSTRQQGSMKLGGLVGELRLDGEVLRRIWPWLWLGQWLHLGSSTTIGLGRYVLHDTGT